MCTCVGFFPRLQLSGVKLAICGHCVTVCHIAKHVFSRDRKNLCRRTNSMIASTFASVHTWGITAVLLQGLRNNSDLRQTGFKEKISLLRQTKAPLSCSSSSRGLFLSADCHLSCCFIFDTGVFFKKFLY